MSLGLFKQILILIVNSFIFLFEFDPDFKPQ